jgi:soluble lytic murein transglycosylase-like protein
MRARLTALFVLAAFCGSGFARTTDNTEPGRAAALPAPAAAMASPPEADDVLGPMCPVPAAYRPAFAAAAWESRLPVAMLVAVSEAESGLRHDAVSPAGARGLLQLMPATASELRVDAAHPTANVSGGARYLRAQLDRFRSTDLALAAYNAGPSAVARAGGAPTGETLTYVANVTARWRALVGCR